MKKAESIPTGIVRGGLWPDHHAALIELLDHHPSRRIGNHLMLNIAEACVEQWPITLHDYNQAIEAGTTTKPVKFTVRQDLYPRLYDRYKTLPVTIRTTVFLNMLNRFADMARSNPEAVTGAMRDLEQGKSSKPALDPDPTSGHSGLPVQVTNVGQVVQSSPSPESSDNHQLAEDDVDPMSKIHTGL
jgi:hypothetical protein